MSNTTIYTLREVMELMDKLIQIDGITMPKVSLAKGTIVLQLMYLPSDLSVMARYEAVVELLNKHDIDALLPNRYEVHMLVTTNSIPDNEDFISYCEDGNIVLECSPNVPRKVTAPTPPLSDAEVLDFYLNEIEKKKAELDIIKDLFKVSGTQLNFIHQLTVIREMLLSKAKGTATVVAHPVVGNSDIVTITMSDGVIVGMSRSTLSDEDDLPF